MVFSSWLLMHAMEVFFAFVLQCSTQSARFILEEVMLNNPSAASEGVIVGAIVVCGQSMSE
jgi:hypothetical protein